MQQSAAPSLSTPLPRAAIRMLSNSSSIHRPSQAEPMLCSCCHMRPRSVGSSMLKLEVGRDVSTRSDMWSFTVLPDVSAAVFLNSSRVALLDRPCRKPRAAPQFRRTRRPRRPQIRPRRCVARAAVRPGQPVRRPCFQD